jgi:hypothetical protein
MICPHCKKYIDGKVTDAAWKKAAKLVNAGYSFRAVEKLLYGEGIQISFASLSRRFSEGKKK